VKQHKPNRVGSQAGSNLTGANPTEANPTGANPAEVKGAAGNHRRLVNVLLLAAVVALFAVPLALKVNSGDQPEGEAYAGTDSAAAAVVSEVDPRYRPWFSPLFEPSSAEVESGLFAIQAALGAGAFGYAFGRLSARRRSLTPAIDLVAPVPVAEA
jgi:cobalt/nickel transport protein